MYSRHKRYACFRRVPWPVHSVRAPLPGRSAGFLFSTSRSILHGESPSQSRQMHPCHAEALEPCAFAHKRSLRMRRCSDIRHNRRLQLPLNSFQFRRIRSRPCTRQGGFARPVCSGASVVEVAGSILNGAWRFRGRSFIRWCADGRAPGHALKDSAVRGRTEFSGMLRVGERRLQ